MRAPSPSASPRFLETKSRTVLGPRPRRGQITPAPKPGAKKLRPRCHTESASRNQYYNARSGRSCRRAARNGRRPSGFFNGLLRPIRGWENIDRAAILTAVSVLIPPSLWTKPEKNPRLGRGGGFDRATTNPPARPTPSSAPSGRKGIDSPRFHGFRPDVHRDSTRGYKPRPLRGRIQPDPVCAAKHSVVVLRATAPKALKVFADYFWNRRLQARNACVDQAI